MSRVLTVLVAAALVAGAFLVASAPHARAALELSGGPAPWPAEHAHLARRLGALRLPGESDAAFHIHARLDIYVDGRRVPVPALIGIDPAGAFLAPLHTHDASGIVHVEASRRFPFTLGEFFTVWGVRFTDRRLGAYASPRVYVNGRRVADPVRHVLRAHDRIVVGAGPPGSFPTDDLTPFPPGL
jgi:hypothetical protein